MTMSENGGAEEPGDPVPQERRNDVDRRQEARRTFDRSPGAARDNR